MKISIVGDLGETAINMNLGSSSYEAIYAKAILSTDQASLSKSNLTAKTILKDLSDVKKIKKLSTKKNQKI